MSCFWRGLIQSINKVQLLQVLGLHTKPAPVGLVRALKTKAVETQNVLWNGQELKEQELKENLEHIKSYNIGNVRNGYWCSGCDPFLLLMCELFQIKIHHKYCGNLIKYYPKDFAENVKIYLYVSNQRHFWFKGLH